MEIGEAIAKLREAKTKATPGRCVAEGDAKGLTWDVVTDEDYICHMSTEQDAKFIALAANIWPELMAVVSEAATLNAVWQPTVPDRFPSLASALSALAASLGEP